MELTGINPFDAAVMAWIQENLHSAFTDAVLPLVTHLGDAGAVWIIFGITLLFFKRTRRTGILLLVSMLLTYLTGEVLLKNLVMRPRPCHLFPEVPLLIARPDSFSFPSGHTASSFAAAVSLTFRHKKAWPALLLAALIAFSRVFLFVHFPTDIIAGAALGTLFAAAVHFAGRRLKSV